MYNFTHFQVVQPKGTYDSVNDIKNLLMQKDRLQVDPKAKYETQNLKNLLSSSKKNSPTNLNVLMNLSEKRGPTKNVASQHEIVSYIRNSTLINHNAFTNPEYFGLTGNLEEHKKMFDEETVWHMADSASSRFHEQISLTKVEQLVNFEVDYDRDIEKWAAFRDQWKINTRISLVGVTSNGIILLKKIDNGYQVVKEIELGTKVYDIELFEIWNNGRVGVAVCSIADEIVWFQTNTEYTDINEVWRWRTHKNVSFMHYYNYKGNDLMLLINGESNSSADIYEFRYNEKQFWIAQILPLQTPSQSISVLDVADNFVICIAQQHEVLVYSYETTLFEKGRVTLQEAIAAPNLTYIKGFEVGGHSFLAIGGSKPRILKYDGYLFEEITILDQSFNNVRNWIPINIHTYRDDLVLIVEHLIEFETHSTAVISALIWDGGAFDVAPFVPCYDEDDDYSMGLSCILDSRRPEGLEGATFIQKQDCVALVIPQRNAPSVLYKLFYEISPSLDPVVQELKEIEAHYEILAEMEQHQDKIIQNAITSIANAFNPELDSYVANQWEINVINTPELYIAEQVHWNEAIFGGHTWQQYDKDIDLNTLELYLSNIESHLNILAESVTQRNFRSHQANSREYRIPYISNAKFTGQYTHQTKDNYHEGFLRPRRETQITGPVEFETLELNELVVENVNGVPVSKMNFAGEEVYIEKLVIGDLLSVHDLILLEDGRVNGIDLDKELIHFQDKFRSFPKLVMHTVHASNETKTKFFNERPSNNTPNARSNEENLDMMRITVKGNLQTQKINGVEWQNIVQKIVPRNLPNKLESLKVEGVSTYSVFIYKFNSFI